MIDLNEGYTVLIQDNYSGEKVQLQTDQTATDVLEAVARAMVALTFQTITVKRAMEEVGGDLSKY